MGADLLGLDGDDPNQQRRRVPACPEFSPERRQDLHRTGSHRASIETVNGGSVWDDALTNIYRRALQLPRSALSLPLDEAPSFHDLDVLMPFVFGTVTAPSDREVRLANAREIGLKTMPLLARTWNWARMAWRREFHFVCFGRLGGISCRNG